MNLDKNSVVVNYPNTFGDSGRYDLKDQRAYFKQFEGGSRYVFRLALENALHGDLLSYSEQCDNCLDNHYQLMFDENITTLELYHDARKEFKRRTLDIYRYARTTLKPLGEELPFLNVSVLSVNPEFDTASFILK